MRVIWCQFRVVLSQLERNSLCDFLGLHVSIDCMFFRRCILIIFCLSTNIYAVDEIPSCRMVGGHLFFPSNLLPIPFLTTDLGTKWQGEWGSVTDPTLSKQYRAAAGGMGFDLQVGVLDYLSIIGSLSGGARFGLKQNLFQAGVLGDWNYSLGVRYKALQTDHWYVSTDLQFIGSGSTGASIRSLPNFIGGLSNPNFIADLSKCAAGGPSMSDGAVPTPAQIAEQQAVNTACDKVTSRLIEGKFDLGARLSASAAWGLNSIFGIWWNATYNHMFRNATNPLDFQGQAQTGIGVSIDLAKKTKVPIGFLLAAQYSFLFDYISTFQHKNNVLALQTGVFYTGMNSLSIGLQVSDEITPQANATSNVYVNWMTAALTLRYYWN